MNLPSSRRRERKRAIAGWLADWRLPEIVAAGRHDAGVASTLTSFLVETDSQLRWRAIHALGLVVGARAVQDLVGVREFIRREFWAMNDESGNVVGHAPEAIAEILFRVPAVCSEYAANLFSHIREPLFRAGVTWGMARLAPRWPALVADSSAELKAALADQNPNVRGYGAVAMVHVLHGGPATGEQTVRVNPHEREVIEELLGRLRTDAGLLVRLDEATGTLADVTVGDLLAAEIDGSGRAHE